VQALLAARHVVRAVGTDTNPRALSFASLNAILNGIENLELLEGSFYEPVSNREFDLVLSNPPFVISPETRFLYRDAGVRGDAASEHVIRGMPRHLREGGFGVVLCNWQHSHDDDWPERPRQWADGSSCDVWVLRFDTLDRLGYAAFWLRQTEEDDRERYGKLLDEWTRYYAEIGMERVSIGAIILRKRTGATNWFRTDKTPGDAATGDCGEHIEAIFAAEDLLHEISDDRELLDIRFRINPAHVLEARMVLRNGDSVAESLRLKLTAGIPFAGAVDPPVVSLLTACDGGRPLRNVVADLAATMELDTEIVAHTALALVKQFLRSGVLRLAGRPC
jgi:methylase of polypeptide subunit release factors